MTNVKILVVLCLSAGLFSVSACSPTSSSDGDGDGDVDSDVDGDADGDADSDGDGDGDGDGDVDADFDNTCDSQQFSISTEPPRVMILLDQSSSMVDSNWGGHTHWQETIDGLTALLGDERVEDFSFGLDPFPDGDLEYLTRCHDECCQNPTCLMSQPMRCMNMSAGCGRGCAVDLPPWVSMGRAPEVADAIIDYVNLEVVPTTFGMTPIVDQLRWYLEDRSAEMPELYANDGSGYLVVLSDGDDTCEDGADDPDVGVIVSALTDVTSRLVTERGIRTFAIGFGDTGGDMARELNAIASAGGTEFTSFFAITSDGALAEAFSEISTSIISCVYDIDEPDATADPEAVNFYFDGEVIGYDATCTTGWRWADEGSTSRVEFCGPQCDQLKDGLVSEIEARFGCGTILW